jgi:hypothetical protein
MPRSTGCRIVFEGLSRTPSSRGRKALDLRERGHEPFARLVQQDEVVDVAHVVARAQDVLHELVELVR